MANYEEQRSVSAEVPPSSSGGVLPHIPKKKKKKTNQPKEKQNGQTVNV